MSDERELVARVFGPGTTPERVAEAIERAQSERERSPRRPSTSEREAFFKRQAEEVKRAGGHPR